MHAAPSAVSCMFQLMPPRGGNQAILSANMTLILFQLMPPRGGNLSLSVFAFAEDMFQLMPPRGGNQLAKLERKIAKVVSTHAPARGQSNAFVMLA